jgi:hypothetical protein
VSRRVVQSPDLDLIGVWVHDPAAVERLDAACRETDRSPVLIELPGVQTSAWRPPVRMVAELDGIRETYEKRVTDRRLVVAAGTIEAGTVGAVRFETIGVVDGTDAIGIEHVNRIAPDLAPEWPTATRAGTYGIVIDGEPNLTCELQVGTPSTFSDEGMLATTIRVVNATPFVRPRPASSPPRGCR